MLQGPGSNKFSQIITRLKSPTLEDLSDMATIAQPQREYKLRIDNFSTSKGIRPSTHKILNACIITFSEQNRYGQDQQLDFDVNIPLREYAQLLGKPVTKDGLKEIKKRVIEDLETLYSCRMSWKEKKGNEIVNYSDIRILDKQGIENGIIKVTLSPNFSKYLVKSYIMSFPKILFRVDERNPSTLILGRKLALHYGIDNNQLKGNANIISVKSLLSECSQTIPRYDEVINSDKRIGDRIIKPFEDALNALSDLDFMTWEYSNPKGVPLTDEQLGNISYADFERLYIKFSVKDFPARL